ncbi:MAG: hypothetical protein N2491_01850 [Negativicutes bacterium]|nr:hypothetical protein [Negativicutes bacterium]
MDGQQKTATGDSGGEKYQLHIKKDRCHRRLKALIENKEALAEVVARNSSWVPMPEYDGLRDAFDAAIEAEAKFLLNLPQCDLLQS